jgi:hypothetical protein
MTLQQKADALTCVQLLKTGWRSQTPTTKYLFEDLETCLQNNQLRDPVLNKYFDLLHDQAIVHGRPHLFCNTFFATRLLNGSRVTHYLRKFQLDRLQLLVLPVHVPLHWYLLVLDFRHETIAAYDSSQSQPTYNHALDLTAKLVSLIQTTASDAGKMAWLNHQTLLYPNVVQQDNSVDCGVYVCRYAAIIAKGGNPIDVDFNPASMHLNYRLDLFVDIANGAMLLTEPTALPLRLNTPVSIALELHPAPTTLGRANAFHALFGNYSHQQQAFHSYHVQDIRKVLVLFLKSFDCAADMDEDLQPYGQHCLMLFNASKGQDFDDGSDDQMQTLTCPVLWGLFTEFVDRSDSDYQLPEPGLAFLAALSGRPIKITYMNIAVNMSIVPTPQWLVNTRTGKTYHSPHGMFNTKGTCRIGTADGVTYMRMRWSRPFHVDPNRKPTPPIEPQRECNRTLAFPEAPDLPMSHDGQGTEPTKNTLWEPDLFCDDIKCPTSIFDLPLPTTATPGARTHLSSNLHFCDNHGTVYVTDTSRWFCPDPDGFKVPTVPRHETNERETKVCINNTETQNDCTKSLMIVC